MNRWTGLASLIAALLAAGNVVYAAESAHAPAIADALVGARYSLSISAGGIQGDGAPLLKAAVRKARYVAVGEDHVTREIPAFVSALCEEMGPQGLGALVLEIGPFAAAELTPILRAPDRLERMAALNARYPNAVAFLDTRADNDAAAQCLASSPAARVVGVDQEFFGAGALLLDRLLELPLSQSARASIGIVRAREELARTEARKSGDSSGLLLMAAKSEDLDVLARVISMENNARASQLVAEMRASHDIYRLNAEGHPEANTDRARLMKRHLATSLPADGKVLLKFGDWHLYKGINPLGNRDLGNFVAERSEGEAGESLHILVLGAAGTHAAFGGFAKPLRREAFKMTDDRHYRWLEQAMSRQVDTGWTLFDLRALRNRKIDGVDEAWSRVIRGYDLLVIIPELTPSDVIGAVAPSG